MPLRYTRLFEWKFTFMGVSPSHGHLTFLPAVKITGAIALESCEPTSMPGVEAVSSNPVDTVVHYSVKGQEFKVVDPVADPAMNWNVDSALEGEEPLFDVQSALESDEEVLDFLAEALDEECFVPNLVV
jgi:hypothetical protein